MRYFKVKYGYDKSAFTVVEEGGNLERALYAWIEQVPVTLGDKMIHGKSILAIEPYYHAHTGWNELYEPKDGEDMAQIKRDCPSYDGVIEHYKDHVVSLMKNNETAKIGKGEIPPMLENEETPNRLTSGLAEKMTISSK